MILIKRYPNRKLYNTDSKQYITLDGIADLIRDDIEIQVIDHASGEDLTALTLTQIILEHEKRQTGLLSHSLLTGLIRASGERLSAFQRNIIYTLSYWHQIDEEIRHRVKALIQQGDLSELEGINLIDKLIQQGARIRDTGKSEGQINSDSLENIFRQRGLPTQEDLKKLYDQLDELSSKVDQINELSAPVVQPDKLVTSE